MAILYYIFFAIGVLNVVVCTVNNVCPTIEDYYTITENPKCWYDFAADSNVTEIISKHGYPFEIHKGVTPDGYILTIIRIPQRGDNNKPSVKGTVFIQHGLHGSASNFVAVGKDSLAFLLVDAGYDVWLGNYRGNEYSQNHINLTTNDRKFWDYSIDDIGLYDIPTQLKVVSDKTGNRGNIVYIGHSIGTAAGFIYGSWYPEQAKKHVRLFIMLAPLAAIPNMLSPIKLVAPLMSTIYNIINDNDLVKLVSQASILKSLVRTICLDSPQLMKRCFEVSNLVVGVNSQMGPEMIPVMLNQYPGGSSLKLLTQGANMMLNFFGRYDYGLGNLAKYGTTTPPQYQVSKIEIPVFLVYSVGDWFCTKKDSQILYNRLSKKAKIYGMLEVSEKKFNHGDFLAARNVKLLVYDHIISLLEKLK